MGRRTARVTKRRTTTLTQEERKAHSKELILSASMHEFGAHGYASVTVDSICAKHGISKGMLYHYYSGKDDLFLLCANQVFHELVLQLKRELSLSEQDKPIDAIKHFFMIRERFLELHPDLKRIFVDALLNTPHHLEKEIHELRRPIRDLNRSFLKKLISGLMLREGLNTESVVCYLESIDIIFPSFIRQICAEKKAQDLHTMLQTVENVLEMVLFGILRTDNTIPTT